METFQPRFKTQAYTTDITPASFMEHPWQHPDAVAGNGRRGSQSRLQARDSVGALLAAQPDEVPPTACRQNGRTLPVRDPNTETDPAGINRHPRVAGEMQHLRRVPEPVHVEHPVGKRHVPPPEVAQPQEDLPALVGAHKRHSPVPSAMVEGDHVANLLFSDGHQSRGAEDGTPSARRKRTSIAESEVTHEPRTKIVPVFVPQYQQQLPRDSVGALLAGHPEEVAESACVHTGRAQHNVRDPNVEAEPAGCSAHARMAGEAQHRRHLTEPVHADHPMGKRHVPAPEVVELEDPIPALAGTHKRRVPAPEVVEPDEPIPALAGAHKRRVPAPEVVEPEEAIPALAGNHKRHVREVTVKSNVAEARRDLAGFFSRRNGGVRPTWMRLARGEFLRDPPSLQPSASLTGKDGSLPLEHLQPQLETLMGKEFHPDDIAAIFGPAVTMPQFISALNL